MARLLHRLTTVTTALVPRQRSSLPVSRLRTGLLGRSHIDGTVDTVEQADQQQPRFAWPPTLARSLDGAGYQALLAAQAIWITTHLGVVAAGYVIVATQLGSALAAPAQRAVQRFPPRAALTVGVALALFARLALGTTIVAPIAVVVVLTGVMAATSWLPDLATKDDVLHRSRSPRTLGLLLFVVTIAHAIGSAVPSAVANPSNNVVLVAVCIVAALCLVPTLFAVHPRHAATIPLAEDPPGFDKRRVAATALLAVAVTGPTAVWASLVTAQLGQSYVTLLGLLYIVSAALALIPAKLTFSSSGAATLAVGAGLSSLMWFIHAGPLWFIATMVLSCVWVIAVTAVALSDSGHRGGPRALAHTTTTIALATAATALITPVIYSHFSLVGVGLSMLVPCLVASVLAPVLLASPPKSTVATK